MILQKQNKIKLHNITLPSDAPEDQTQFLKDYYRLSVFFEGAMNEVATKLETLDNEFHTMYDHNPIHHMECRIKSLESIIGKLRRRNLNINTQNIFSEIQDFAGIRVICNYLDDITYLCNVIERHHCFKVIKKKDYISNPKPNGYRSLHLIVEISVAVSSAELSLPVEIQLRTIAMDMWASLEHELNYKANKQLSEANRETLLHCANTLNQLEEKMQFIYQQLSHTSPDPTQFFVD